MSSAGVQTAEPMIMPKSPSAPTPTKRDSRSGGSSAGGWARYVSFRRGVRTCREMKHGERLSIREARERPLGTRPLSVAVAGARPAGDALKALRTSRQTAARFRLRHILLGALVAASTSGGSAASQASPPEPASPCRYGYSAPTEAGAIENPFVREASGLAASRRHPGVLWTHQDSGSGPVLHALMRDGSHLGNYRLAVDAVDWEDVALGPGPSRDQDALYVGDIGDNHGRRASIVVHRVPEPEVTPGQAPVDVVLPSHETFTFRYPNGPRDAEALVVDPERGDVYVVTKVPPEIFVARAPLRRGIRRLRRVAALTLPDGVIPVVTAADATPGGDAVLVRTYFDVVRFPRAPGRPFWTVFRAEGHALQAPIEHQGEAIAAAVDGFFTVAEGLRPPLFFARTCMPAQ